MLSVQKKERNRGLSDVSDTYEEGRTIECTASQR